jgi:hypothetical protein
MRSAVHEAASVFLGCRLIGVMADHRQHGEGQHHQGNVTVPAVPRSGFIVRQAKFVLGGLEAVFDGPAMPLDSNERLDQRSGRASGGEVSHFAIGDMAADQQTARPKPLCF